jgi:hypothetical protein
VGCGKSGFQKMPNQYIFTPKITTAILDETLDNFQHSTLLIPEGRSCTLNSSPESLRTRDINFFVFLYVLE